MKHIPPTWEVRKIIIDSSLCRLFFLDVLKYFLSLKHLFVKKQPDWVQGFVSLASSSWQQVFSFQGSRTQTKSWIYFLDQPGPWLMTYFSRTHSCESAPSATHFFSKHVDIFSWAVLSDEQMSNGWPFSLLNDEQMHQPVRHVTWYMVQWLWRYLWFFFLGTKFLLHFAGHLPGPSTIPGGCCESGALDAQGGSW